MSIIDFLKLPEAKTIENLDSPSTTLLHKEIILKKPFLKRIYIDHYRQILGKLGEILPTTKIVELGSGGGFLKEVLPQTITSEILNVDNVDMRFSATDMPFADNSLDAIVMIDVLHHIPDSRAFFNEANRCLKAGGKIIMIEPANTLFSRLIYRKFHHEPFDPKGDWGFSSEGPLSSANGAIPWIIFLRDRAQFEKEFPQLKISSLKHHTPLRYLLSGGLSLKQLVPSFTYSLFYGLEIILSPLSRLLGMFLTVELTKN